VPACRLAIGSVATMACAGSSTSACGTHQLMGTGVGIMGTACIMKLLSCNVNGRTKSALGRQLSAVLARRPDILAQQEVTSGTYAPWCQGLLRAGYSVVANIDLLALPYPQPPYVESRQTRTVDPELA
jgi:hypothetical protein